MPGVMPRLVIPTEYDAQQKALETRRRIADAMLQKGMTTNPNMSSWAQVLAQIAEAYVGKSLEKKSDQAEGDLSNRIRGDYTGRVANFFKDVHGGTTVDQLVEKYSSDPMLADTLKPYADALAHRLSQNEDVVNNGGRWDRKGDIIGTYEPSKPTDSVIRGQDGSWQVNPVRATAALSAQYPPEGASAQGMTYSMPDPNARVAPPQVPQTAVTPPTNPGQGPGGMPPEAGNQGAMIDISKLTPTERDILQNEIKRRAGAQPDQNFTLQNDMHTPFGNPLTAQKPPAGVVNGKPYWIINGVPFDNPDGK